MDRDMPFVVIFFIVVSLVVGGFLLATSPSPSSSSSLGNRLVTMQKHGDVVTLSGVTPAVEKAITKVIQSQKYAVQKKQTSLLTAGLRHLGWGFIMIAGFLFGFYIVPAMFKGAFAFFRNRSHKSCKIS